MRRRRPAADPAAPAGARNGVVSKAPSVESSGDDGGQHRHQQELENDLPLSRVLLASLPLLVLSAVASTNQVGLYKLSADLLIAAIRTLAQLSCLALVLTPIFHSENHSRLFTCSYVFLFMLPLAAYEATARSDLTYPGAYRDSLLGLGIGVVATLSLAVFGVVRSSPWYSPRVVIPLGGMLISNALSGMSLASSELLGELHNRSERVEVLLAFGATPWEATRMAMSSALGKALMPTISSMNVIGLVAIPGMMTGQVLSGASPVRAGRYQIMIMYMIAACTFLATVVTVSLMVENLFDGRGVYRAKDVVKNDAPGVSQLLSSGRTWLNLSASSAKRLDSVGVDGLEKIVNNTPPIELRAEAMVRHQIPNETPVLVADILGSVASGQSFGASIALREGEIACLTGKTGIGKSTMLRALTELSSSFKEVKNTRIQLNGVERKLYAPTEWRRNVLYLPQGISSFLPGTPEDLIADLFRLKIHKKSNAAPTETVKSFLREWGIEDPSNVMGQYWSDLSGGEGQRLILAIALASDSKVLLVDEATGALDEATKSQVEATIKRLRRTILMVTHDEDQAMRLCSSRWRLIEGDL